MPRSKRMRYTFSSLPRATSQPVIAWERRWSAPSTLPGDDAAAAYRLFKWTKSTYVPLLSLIFQGVTLRVHKFIAVFLLPLDSGADGGSRGRRGQRGQRARGC
ncbi:hypothetical protein DL89DRAFT_55369 [Linderina pennispora]|uniref:Uncharacterized protein n=1 Tax=Linderina pennispora TaxID=61395 RepID=A0A1Y1W152_9FUNG|nr:uncharacterized protein DL89DRAFT_55369 [Linderina pennispora]ORX67237.1 hypothetical protein DL89DRAFT_55369 [Linderina pennispora]